MVVKYIEAQSVRRCLFGLYVGRVDPGEWRCILDILATCEWSHTLQLEPNTNKIKLILKGHCHGDFAVCWTKQLKYLTKKPLLEREIALRAVGGKYEMISLGKNNLESVFSNFPKIHRRNLTKWTNFFKLQFISILVIRRQKWLISSSSCALVELFLIKLNHYSNVPSHTNVFFRWQCPFKKELNKVVRLAT